MAGVRGASLHAWPPAARLVRLTCRPWLEPTSRRGYPGARPHAWRPARIAGDAPTRWHGRPTLQRLRLNKSPCSISPDADGVDPGQRRPRSEVKPDEPVGLGRNLDQVGRLVARIDARQFPELAFP